MKRIVVFFFRRALPILFALCLISAAVLLLINRNQADRRQRNWEQELLLLKTIDEIESVLGRPVHIYSDNSTQFGKGIVTPTEFEHGVTIRVYMIENTPRFLVVKLPKDSRLILQSIIEAS
jgi:hypothetical protein